MSSILKNDYVGRVDLTDPNYPWGKGQNRLGSVPNTGTPFDEKWFNDFEGNKQAYLRLAGIVPSGTPDNAVESDQLEAIKRISNAFLVGNPAGSFRYGFDFTSANDVGIANDGTFWKYSGTDPYPVTVAEDTDPTAGDFTQAFARDGQPNPVGSFSDVGGVTFNFPNDVARDSNGEYWAWTGSLPYTAAQNTVPSEPNYSKRLANVAENISVSEGSSVQDYINNNLTPFKTVSAMRAYNYSSIPVDSRIYWQGYYAQSDGGSNWGVLKKGDSTSLTDDGGSIFIIVNDAVNGIWVEANLKGKRINVRKFGAAGNGVNEDASNIQKAMNYCWDSKSELHFPSGRYRVSEMLRPMAKQDASSNFHMPYAISFSGSTDCFIDYFGTGVCLDLTQKAFQKSARYGEILGGVSIRNAGDSGTIGVHAKGLNHWNFARMVVEGFSDTQVLVESQNGKGGLWNRFEDLEVRGTIREDYTVSDKGNYGLRVGNVANANFFDRLWAGYCDVDQVLIEGDRTVINSLSIEDGGEECQTGIRIKNPVTIFGVEIEMNGTTGNANFLGGIYVEGDESTFVSVFQYAAVGVTPRYAWSGNPQVIIYPTRTATSLSDQLEIITSNPLLIENLRSRPRIKSYQDEHTVGVNNNYSGYQFLWGSGNIDVIDAKNIQITNNTDQNIDIQIRMENSLAQDGSPIGKAGVAAGSTVVFTQEEIASLYAGLPDDSILNTIKARYRTSAASYTGQVDTSVSGFIL